MSVSNAAGADGDMEVEDDVEAVLNLNIPGIAAMKANDSLLNDGIEDEVRKFLDNGGTPSQAFQVLTDSYEGASDMITALVQWTEMFKGNDESDVLTQAIETVLRENENTIVGNLDKAMMREAKAPEFLSELNAQPHWRNVINDLGRRNKSSALFNMMARQSRLEDVGVDQGIMDTPETFLKAVYHEIQTLCEKPVFNEKDLKKFYQNLRHMCTFDETGALLAIRLFSMLALETTHPPTRDIFRRASQEIRLEAVKTMQNESGVPRPTAVQFIERIAVVCECKSAKIPLKKDVLSAIGGLLYREKVSGRKMEAETSLLNQTFKGILGEPPSDQGDTMSDVNANPLVQNFTPEEAHKREQMIAMLCHAEIYKALIDGLFTKEKRRYAPNTNDVDMRRRHCLCMLLSYSGVFLAEAPGEFKEKLQNAEALQELRTKTKDLRLRLEKVMGVVETLTPGCPRFKFKGKPVAILLEQLEDPVIACGLLAWAREGLRGGPDQRTLLVTTPKHLAYIEGVADKHVALRKEALEILHEGFMAPYEVLDVLDAERLKDMYIVSMISMIPLYMASHIVDRFLSFYADCPAVDLAHLRRFVKGLLSFVEPPYKPSFAQLVLKLVNHPRMVQATAGEAETSNMIIAFRSDARKMGLES